MLLLGSQGARTTCPHLTSRDSELIVVYGHIVPVWTSYSHSLFSSVSTSTLPHLSYGCWAHSDTQDDPLPKGSREVFFPVTFIFPVLSVEGKTQLLRSTIQPSADEFLRLTQPAASIITASRNDCCGPS